jgi:hypothetical protein
MNCNEVIMGKKWKATFWKFLGGAFGFVDVVVGCYVVISK